MTASYREQISQLRARYESLVVGELEGYRSALSLMRRVHAMMPPKEARPLTIPAIFGRTFDENFLSDYLAHVLTPAQSALGEAPLQALIACCSAGSSDADLEVVEVTRERALEGRRIDLLIEVGDSLVIGIENKIMASERGAQTRHYAKAIKAEWPDHDHLFIYLSPDGHGPSSRFFQALSYGTLLAAWRVLPYDWRGDPRGSILWEDLLEHIEHYITMSKKSPALSERSQLYFEHREMIDDLLEALAEDDEVWFEHVEAQLLDHLEGAGWEVDFKYGRVDQIVTREDWWADHLSFSLKLRLDDNLLTSECLEVMLDIKGKRREDARVCFREKYPNIEEEFIARGVEHPTQSGKRVATKAYDLPEDKTQLVRVFLDALDDFSFLFPVIEEIVREVGAVGEA